MIIQEEIPEEISEEIQEEKHKKFDTPRKSNLTYMEILKNKYLKYKIKYIFLKQTILNDTI